MHGSIKNDKQLSPEKQLFQCLKCPNVYKKESSLNEHMSLMHCINTSDEKFEGIGDKYQQIGNDVPPILTRAIGVSIIFAQAKTEAEKTPLPFKCKMCYKSFQIEQNLNQHETLYHGKKMSPGKKFFQCSKCPKFYTKESSLNHHISLMHLSKKSDENISLEIKTLPLLKVSYPNAKCAIKDLKRNRRSKKQ